MQNNVKTILVIDDDESILEVVELVLVTEGYKVYLALDGEEGIEQAKKYLPDLIILDITMPNMNGFLFSSLLANDKKLKQIPILLLTATPLIAGGVTIEIPCVKARLDKPFDYKVLLKHVNDIISENKITKEKSKKAS